MITIGISYNLKRREEKTISHLINGEKQDELWFGRGEWRVCPLRNKENNLWNVSRTTRNSTQQCNAMLVRTLCQIPAYISYLTYINYHLFLYIHPFLHALEYYNPSHHLIYHLVKLDFYRKSCILIGTYNMLIIFMNISHNVLMFP